MLPVKSDAQSVSNVVPEPVPELVVVYLPDVSKNPERRIFVLTGEDGVCHVAAVELVAVNT